MLNSKNGSISRATVDRLPLYFRTLRLIKTEGSDIVSSEELGNRIGVTPEQIRKDLASFGAFGKKGVGYHVAELLNNISLILGLDRKWNIAIIGVGHLGWALANYRNFASLGFQLTALFDQNPFTLDRFAEAIRTHLGPINSYLLPAFRQQAFRFSTNSRRYNCEIQISHVGHLPIQGNFPLNIALSPGHHYSTVCALTLSKCRT